MFLPLLHLSCFLSTEDKCYYSETRELSEYVLNTRGKIWVGSADSNYGRPWQFAQFTPQALDVAMWVLERLPAQDRADPIKVYIISPRLSG